MRPHQLAAIRKEVYNHIKQYDGNVELPPEINSMFELYDIKKAIAEFYETPLRWYPSGKKVYTPIFRIKIKCKMLKERIRLYWWLLKQKFNG